MWENINAFDIYPEKLEVFKADGVMNDLTLESYKEAIDCSGYAVHYKDYSE